jgi:hypothetical protein
MDSSGSSMVSLSLFLSHTHTHVLENKPSPVVGPRKLLQPPKTYC